MFSLLSSCLLCKNLEIKIYKTIILPIVTCVKLDLTQSEDQRLMVYENKV